MTTLVTAVRRVCKPKDGDKLRLMGWIWIQKVECIGRIQDSPGQGDNLISWYIEYSYQNNFVRKVPLTVQGYQVVPREQIFVSIGDIL